MVTFFPPQSFSMYTPRFRRIKIFSISITIEGIHILAFFFVDQRKIIPLFENPQSLLKIAIGSELNTPHSTFNKRDVLRPLKKFQLVKRMAHCQRNWHSLEYPFPCQSGRHEA